ncbi:unnamed protein product [Rhodiola kirilowii]
MHRCTSSVVSSSSSASASANRSSFASYFHDRHSSASDGYQHLARHVSGGESLSGLDSDPDKHFTVHRPSGFNNTRDQMYKDGGYYYLVSSHGIMPCISSVTWLFSRSVSSNSSRHFG